MVAYLVVSTVALLITGWLAGAESASYRLVQPVIETLAVEPQVRMHQGMLRTFGQVMPVLMPTAALLTVGSAILAPTPIARTLWFVAAVCLLAQTVSTLRINVPINTRTGTWDPLRPPEDWQADRQRWHTWQGFRVAMLIKAFVFATLAVVTVPLV